jgi:hypothetical protein
MRPEPWAGSRTKSVVEQWMPPPFFCSSSYVVVSTLTPARSSGPLAPRGANRAAVLRVVEERPGVGVAELASASGVGRTVPNNLLRTLEQRGEVAKEELPGGTTG